MGGKIESKCAVLQRSWIRVACLHGAVKFISRPGSENLQVIQDLHDRFD